MPPLASKLPTQLFAGLDGGASKTRVRVVDGDGQLVGQGTAGPGSLTLSPEMAAANCRHALQQALSGTGLDAGACRLVCGVAGCRQTELQREFERLLDDVGSVDIISDGYAALLGAHGGEAGAIVVTGTGSVGLRLDVDGKLRQVGGFGPVVGDEGGGNWLGRKAIRAALRNRDEMATGVEAISPLAASLVDLMGADHEAILGWIATADATRFAGLVPLILDHEASGDPLACRLLKDATTELGRLIRLTGDNGRVPVSLLGGLAETLASRLPSARLGDLAPPKGDPIDGALLRAHHLAPPEAYIE